MELTDITLAIQLEQLVPPTLHSINCSPPFSVVEVGNDNCWEAIRQTGEGHMCTLRVLYHTCTSLCIS